MYSLMRLRILEEFNAKYRGSLACTNFTSANFTSTNFQIKTIPWIARTKNFTSTMFYKTAST